MCQNQWPFLFHKNYTCFCIRTLELANSIDSTENLANSKVFLVHGADDTIVDPLFAKKIEAYYEGFNVDMNAKILLALVQLYKNSRTQWTLMWEQMIDAAATA